MKFISLLVKCLKKTSTQKNIKNNFKKELIETKKTELDFEITNKYHICNNLYSNKHVRQRDHCHRTGKYRGSAH